MAAKESLDTRSLRHRAGEQGRARGRWPMPRGLGALIDQLEDEYEAVASDAHMSPLDLRSVT